jgi:hypothetical protein
VPPSLLARADEVTEWRCDFFEDLLHLLTAGFGPKAAITAILPGGDLSGG